MNLEQIKNNYAVSQGYKSWFNLLCSALPNTTKSRYINEVMILVQKECLKRASENAYLNGSEYSRCGCEINKESITNEINIIK